MTTSDQPSPLTVDEIDALRRASRDAESVDPALLDALVAKGMLQHDAARFALTPAGEHALHVGRDPTVPGLDN